MLPTISVITPSYNQGAYLEETIRSVLDQRYPRLEYVVIDGGSTDDSIEVIRRYTQHLAYWVTEPDRGQAHAINKGLDRATGDIVAFLNSDDVYLPGAFAAVVEYFRENPDCRWVCGDTILFWSGIETVSSAVSQSTAYGRPSDGNRRTTLVRAEVPRSAAHALSWSYRAPQPGMFWKRELLESRFQEQWCYCFDHEMYVRLLLDGHICEHLSVPVAAYRLHSASKTVAEPKEPRDDKDTEGRLPGPRFGLMSSGQADDFDRIADLYESRLRGSGKRWCAAIRFLRHSYAASQVGRLREASLSLGRALLIHPESLLMRPFWGCLRQVLARASCRWATSSPRRVEFPAKDCHRPTSYPSK